LPNFSWHQALYSWTISSGYPFTGQWKHSDLWTVVWLQEIFSFLAFEWSPGHICHDRHFHCLHLLVSHWHPNFFRKVLLEVSERYLCNSNIV
jgi:hypothetical protein